MAYKWTQKALIDECLQDYWDVSSNATSLAKIIGWINEIQDDLVKDIRIPYFKLELKKLLPTSQNIINLDPQVPDAPTAALASGGSLTSTNLYKVYVTFIIWDDEQKRYIESEPSDASGAITADASNGTINVSAIDTYNGDTSVNPTTIWRRIYVAEFDTVNSASDYGDPLFSQDIEDNTTTTATITTVPTSTITPPSDTEIDEIVDETMVFASGSQYLRHERRDAIRRYSPSLTTTSASPYYFDWDGPNGIFLWPQLVSTATNAQRTLIYQAYRRPHEVFYEKTRAMDLPIQFKMALKAGVKWKGYDHRDREGYRSREDIYRIEKKKLENKYARTRGGPISVRDVNGDVDGFTIE